MIRIFGNTVNWSRCPILDFKRESSTLLAKIVFSFFTFYKYLVKNSICFGVLAKIRYTWPLFAQNQLHAKNKYKTRPRSPAIGQADLATDFDS